MRSSTYYLNPLLNSLKYWFQLLTFKMVNMIRYQKIEVSLVTKRKTSSLSTHYNELVQYIFQSNRLERCFLIDKGRSRQVACKKKKRGGGDINLTQYKSISNICLLCGTEDGLRHSSLFCLFVCLFVIYICI